MVNGASFPKLTTGAAITFVPIEKISEISTCLVKAVTSHHKALSSSNAQ